VKSPSAKWIFISRDGYSGEIPSADHRLKLVSMRSDWRSSRFRDPRFKGVDWRPFNDDNILKVSTSMRLQSPHLFWDGRLKVSTIGERTIGRPPVDQNMPQCPMEMDAATASSPSWLGTNKTFLPARGFSFNHSVKFRLDGGSSVFYLASIDLWAPERDLSSASLE